jgi:pyruvate,water dikinase
VTPWTVDLTDATPTAGGKARSLADLIRAGFDVPPGFVVTADALDAVLDHAGVGTDVTALLGSLPEVGVATAGPALRGLLADLVLPEPLAAEVRDRLRAFEPSTRFAVRSSGAREDGGDLSYAGQYETVLDVPADAVPSAILDCYRSTVTDAVLSYHLDHGIEATGSAFAVIVQEMVPAEVSGVAFTVNPLTGADTEVVVEGTHGLGDDLVSGRVRATRHVHDWYRERTLEPGDVLSPAEAAAVVRMALDVQRHVGFPCDVEWAIAAGRLRVLQARPITRILHTGIPDQWSNADFKDGGVSATVCTPYMWSLYAAIWEKHLRAFMLDSALLAPAEIRQLGHMFYGRPYWNMSVVKAAMAAAPGYRERQFDEEFGVRITYEGDGDTTPVTPRTLLRIARVALRQRRIVRNQRETVVATCADLLRVANGYEDRLATTVPCADEVKRTWRTLVYTDYDRSEGTYFRQIFINTIHQALTRDAVVAVVGEAGFFRLISGLDEVSHLRPFRDAWTLSRTIHADPAALAYWTGHSVAEITAALDAGQAGHGLDAVRTLIDRYGYHSTRELDVTHPDFDEDHAAVVTMVRDTVLLDDSHAPDADRARLLQAYEAELVRATTAVGPLRAGAFRRRIERTRRMLWWREELRDVSTRYYHLIRLVTLRLATTLVAEGVLTGTDDIWFLPIDSIASALDGYITRTDLRAEVERNRTYYDSFRHYTPPNEIGQRFDRPATGAPAWADGLVGVGASPGVVEGTARVIAGLDDIDRLQPGDILVTRYTDTGWTGKFALISGIVTEYGGVLAHAAIVSREYGIPCIVACHDAMAHIADGQRVRIDGTTGEVVVL